MAASYNVKPEESIEEYFIKRNKAINKAIVKEYRDTPYLTFTLIPQHYNLTLFISS